MSHLYDSDKGIQSSLYQHTTFVMEVFMRGIPLQADEAQIHDHFRNILHNPELSVYWKMGWPMNFTIFLHHYSRRRRHQRRTSVTTGVLRIPDFQIALQLIAISFRLPTLCGCRIKLSKSRNNIDPHDVETLRLTPYRDPQILRQQLRLEQELNHQVRLKSLQFGWLDRDQVFSPEWSREYEQEYPAVITFDPGKRALVIEEKGGWLFGHYNPRRVVVRFGSVDSLSYSRADDPQSALLFTLRAPPVFEESLIATTPNIFSDLWTQQIQDDDVEKRARRSSLHDLYGHHARLAPYISLAFLISVESGQDRDRVLSMSRVAHLPKAEPFFATPVARNHFSSEALTAVEEFIASFEWSIAFQLSVLLKNLMVSAKELLFLRRHIEEVVRRHASDSTSTHVAEIIIEFGEQLKTLNWRNPSRDALRRIEDDLNNCFQAACEFPSSRFRLRTPEGNLTLCYHVNVTPTSIMPDGPYPDQVSSKYASDALQKCSFMPVVKPSPASLSRPPRLVPSSQFFR